MKSAHRHELETNALAHNLEVYIEKYKPYLSKIAFGVIALIALLFLWSYVSGMSSAKKSEAWDSFNAAVASVPPNLEQLHRAAEENQGTGMQRMADVTWADGQVFLASRAYISSRSVANEALNKAASAYQGVLASSDDPMITGRARLGLARVYEMQNELDKAKAQYEQVTGPFEKYAKAQAERLAKPEAKETYAWLATAQAPVSRAPMGPGVPGKQPEFTPGEIALPNSTGGAAGTPEDTKNASQTLDELLKDMTKEPPAGDAAGAKTEQPAGAEAKSETPATPAPPAEPKADQGATGGGAQPATPAGEKAAK